MIERPKQLDSHVFLVGAGISIDPPSHIPPAAPICDFLMQWLSGGDNDVYERLRERSRPGNSHNPYDFVRFESLIHRIAQVDPGITTQLALLETYGFPNAHHIFLAMALRGGASVITTNFDNRIELAGALLDWSVPVLRLSRRSPAPSGHGTLVKVHGSFPAFRDYSAHSARASLPRIGSLGLAFSRYPRLRRWFASATTGRRLHVLGYSASDSFDVVPLLEQCSRASGITWFEYRQDQHRMRRETAKAGSSDVVPRTRTADFVSHTIELTARHHRAGDVCRVFGASLQKHLNREFPEEYARCLSLEQRLLSDSSATGDLTLKNLQMFAQGVEALGFENAERQVIIDKLLRDDSFGENTIRPLSDEETAPEPGPITKTVRDRLKSGGVELASKYLSGLRESDSESIAENRDVLEARAHVLMEGGRIQEAYELLEPVFSRDIGSFKEDPEIGVMLAEGEFSQSAVVDDLGGMRRARKKALKWSRFGGLVEAEQAALHRELSPREVSKALENAKEAAYYSLRTGSEYWFAEALRQYANFLNRFGKHREARQILMLGIDWISPISTMARAVTLWCAAVSALREGNKRLARDIRQELDRLPAASWRGKKLFTLMYDAYRCVMARRLIEAGKLLDEAEVLLEKDPQLDRWGHSQNIRRLRNQIDVLSQRA
jgi:tetratricopeptide (TPR) repeat protein